MKSADRTAFPDVILLDNAFQHVRDLPIAKSNSRGGEIGTEQVIGPKTSGFPL